MKVRNILKGIGKLVLATSLMCGIGLFLCQDVKAGTPTATIDRVESDGTIVVIVNQDDETIPANMIQKIGVYNGATESSAVEYGIFTDTNGIANGEHKIPGLTVLEKNVNKSVFTAQNIYIEFVIGGTSLSGTATDSGKKTKPVYTVKAETTGASGAGTAKVWNAADAIIDPASKIAYGYDGAKVGFWIEARSGVLKEWRNNVDSEKKKDETFEYTINGKDITWTADIVGAAKKITVDTKDAGSTLTVTGSKTFPIAVVNEPGGSWTSKDIDWTYSTSLSSGSVTSCDKNGSGDLQLIVASGTLGTVTVTGTIKNSTLSGDLTQTFYVVIAKGLTNVTINGETSGGGKGFLNTAFSVNGGVNPGANATYKWTVVGPGGGSTGGSFANDTAQSTTYTPTAKGTHTITLTATDTLDGTTTKKATLTLTVDDRSNKLTFDLQNPEVTVGYKNIVVAKVTEGTLNGFSASDFKLTSTDTDKVSFESSTPTISGDGSTLTFIIEGKKASTDAKVSISGPSGVTVAYNNNTVKVYDLGSVDYNSSSRTLTVKMPDKVITGPNVKNNLKEVTGFKLKAYHGDEEIASLDKSGKNTNVTATELENIVTNNASKFSGETDSIWFKIIPYGTNLNGDKAEAKDKDDKVIARNTDGIAVYRVQVSGENLQTTTTYGLQGQQVKVTATPNPGCTFEKWSDGTTTPTKTITVSSTTANNNLTGKAVLGDRVPGSNGSGGAGGSGGDTSGLDRVPKTAESNAPIWLIIVLVFAAMGGGYALYLQMRPVKEDSNTKDNN